MNLLEETLQNILPLDKIAMQNVEDKLQELLPNSDDFGHLKEILINYAGITRENTPSIPKKCTVVACSDHGVAEMKISAYPVETTVHMTRNYLISKGAVANALSNFSGAHMIVVDMGIAAPMGELAGLIDRKIAFGTKNCTKEPAMTRAQAIESLHTGIALANAYSAKGYRCFLPGEMGIANTTSSAAIVATICGLPPEKATGRGTNISDERLQIKIEVVRQALAVNRPDPTDGIDILAKVGGFELGCIAGLILGAAANRSFVVLDGFNTGAAALIACTICPLARNYLMGSHLAAEPAHQKTLDHLGIRPYMDMKFRLGEATGSSIAVNLLDAMIRAYTSLSAKNPVPLVIKKAPDLAGASSREKIEKRIAEIQPLNSARMEECQLYIDNLTKPIHSLGVLENLAVKIAGITGSAKPHHLQKAILSFITDTAHVPASALTQAFAAHAAAELRATQLPSDENCTETAIYDAMEIGAYCAGAAVDCDKKLIGLCASAPRTNAAALEILHHYLSFPNANPICTLQRNHATELAALTGAILGTAAQHGVVILDDFPTQIAALLAVKLSPQIQEYLILPETAPHKEHQPLAALLPLPSYLDLNMTIGSGAGSALGMKLIDAGMHMLNDMKTFEEAAVAIANDGPGAQRQKKTVGHSAK